LEIERDIEATPRAKIDCVICSLGKGALEDAATTSARRANCARTQNGAISVGDKDPIAPKTSFGAIEQRRITRRGYIKTPFPVAVTGLNL